MTTFDERENAFETEFAHQEELRFKTRERAVTLLALWAAKHLGRSAEASADYAREVVAMDVANSASGAAFERILTDLRAKGISGQEIHQAVDQFLASSQRPSCLRSPSMRSRCAFFMRWTCGEAGEAVHEEKNAMRKVG
jgi:hypothetical protein